MVSNSECHIFMHSPYFYYHSRTLNLGHVSWIVDSSSNSRQMEVVSAMKTLEAIMVDIVQG